MLIIRGKKMDNQFENIKTDSISKPEKYINKIRLFFCLAMAAVIAACCVTAFIDFKYANAVELFNKKDYNTAASEFSKISFYKNSTDYYNQCYYNIAIGFFDEGNYSWAKDTFSEIQDYKDSKELIKECDYQTALEYMSNGDYKTAIETFTSLGDYSDSADKVTQCIVYSKYAPCGIYDSETIEDSENYLQNNVYGTWYSQIDGSQITIDEQYINGSEYKFLQADSDPFGDFYFIYYIDDTSKQSDLIYYGSIDFDNIGVSVDTLYINNDYYVDVSKEDYDYYVEQNELNSQYYSDDEIIQFTKELLNRAVSDAGVEAYNSIFGGMFSSVSINSAYVEYEPYEKIYTCYVDAEISSNVLDLSGKRRCTVTATFKDTGSSLILLGMSDFSVM